MAGGRPTFGGAGCLLAALAVAAACSPAPRADGIEIGEQYVRCADHLGFDPGAVSLTTDPAGATLSFTSSVDVPGDVHGPCLALLTTSPPTGISSHGNVGDADRESLAANTYDVCVWSRGFDVGGVQAVYLGTEAVPSLMKTGAEVPAGIHGPCFAELTGAPPDGRSSWGR